MNKLLNLIGVKPYFCLLPKIPKTMRITIVLLISVFFQTHAENLYSQSAQISLNLNNTTIEEVLEMIENQSEFSFLFNSKLINVDRKVSINVADKSVESILTQLFNGSDVQYKIENKQIVLSKKTFLTKLPDQETKGKFHGTIIDVLNEPLIGVNVLVKGSAIGTSTDIDGNFYLSEVSPNSEIIISYIGYKTQNMILGDKTTAVITLIEDSEALDEVVVLGYGVQKKVNLAGAISTVSAKTLEDRPVMSVGQALQGTVSNLQVSIGSGQANSSPEFNIRGKASLNGGNPLIVIDGIISDKDQLNRMAPSDIESISVLKDASSAAIYGSRAAFGVILVTTKSGKGEKLAINYNNNFVFRQITKLPDLVTDPYEVVKMKNIMSYPWYNLYNEEEVAYAKKRSEDLNENPYYLKPDGSWSYFGNTDWVDEAYKNTGFSTLHNFDISGKTQKVSYYFSSSYSFQDGMIKYGTDKYNKYNLRAKVNYQLTDWWSIGNNTSYVSANYDSPNGLNDSFYWEIYRTNSLEIPRNPNGKWTKSGASTLGLLGEGGRYKTINTTFNTQFSTKIDILKDKLFVQANFAYKNDLSSDKSYSVSIPYMTGPELPVLYKNQISSANNNSANTEHILFDVFATYQQIFNKKHAVNILVGFNQEEYNWNKLSAGRSEFISNSLPSLGLATGDMSVGESISSWALRGAFARVNYTFEDKYIFEFNGRYDGTSRFPKDDRFVFNPSGSAAWVVSRESFFQPITDVISFFKVRASYGNLGNQDVGAYAYLATMGSGKTSQIFDGKQPVYVSAPGLVSGSLTWEKITTKNIGLDVNFLSNRLVFSGDLYQRDTKDMLTKGRTLPGVLGTSEPQENAADLETKGWELSLGWTDNIQVSGKPFNYGATFILSDSRSYITKFDNPTGNLSDYYVGMEFGELWGLKTLGYFTSEEEIKNHADQSLLTSYPGTRPLGPGDLKFEDTNGDGVVDWGKWTTNDHGDYEKIGNTQARFNFGFTANADWNGFDFNIFFQGVGKKDYYPGSGDLFFWGIYSQPWSNVTVGNLDHWTPENPNAYFPRLKSYVAESGSKECGAPQTKYLQNAAYVRLKNLTFGYTIPKEITRKAQLERVRVFFSGDNLCEFSGLDDHYKVDPEGLGGQMYPFQRSYSFGLNVSF